MKRFLYRALLLAIVFALPAGAAHAYTFKRSLQKGDEGRAVRALQVRVAGWLSDKAAVFSIDGEFGPQTSEAIKAFESAYGLKVNGIAGKADFRVLKRLEDEDGSTAHFDWEEFEQNASSLCGAKANAYANTLKGGPVSPRRTRRYVKRLMWRLEAIRKKAGGKPIGINSGFRSVAYNDCIGGARASQHLYGTAADSRQVGVSNDRQRRLARRSQFHGIGCYSSQTHNHLDLRMDNGDLPSQQHVWWPDKDRRGRELDEAGIPCWGESSTSTKSLSAGEVLAGAVSTAPSQSELQGFVAEGEGLLPPGVD
jgi:peptidoglycan hydrolase-like protein with peptidoglycan-binding domain